MNIWTLVNFYHLPDSVRRFLKKHTIREDLNHRVKLLSALTEDGKDIVHFEEEVS